MIQDLISEEIQCHYRLLPIKLRLHPHQLIKLPHQGFQKKYKSQSIQGVTGGTHGGIFQSWEIHHMDLSIKWIQWSQFNLIFMEILFTIPMPLGTMHTLLTIDQWDIMDLWQGNT